MSELDDYRAKIDEIDSQLVPLFLRRMAVTKKVGEYKKERGLPVLDSNREKEVLAAKTALVSDPGEMADVAALYESIMAISRRQQQALIGNRTGDPGYAQWHKILDTRRQSVDSPQVVYQGEPGAYSEEAAVGFFGEDVQTRGLAWFDDVFLALAKGEADYAVLPIENSSTGSIRQVYDLLAQYDFFLVGEWQVKVEHCLAALPGVGIEDIQTVYSHEQGLMQCDKFLDGHRNWERVPVLDTAGSARQVAATNDQTAGAICSRRAAKLYGLNILACPINHNTSNFTRFVVVSPVPELRQGRNKAVAEFTLPHRAGSLHEILTIFAVHGLNLMKLESRPLLGREWEYRFFVEFAGDLTAPDMDGVLHELGQLAADLRILGNFKGYDG